MTILISLTLMFTFTLTATAGRAYPTSRAARAWRPPGWWLVQAACIHRHEWRYSWHIAGVDYLGRKSPYYGGLQFLVSTWRAAGGTGLPSDWSQREQQYRAWVVWNGDSGSWHEWGTAKACGLR